MRHRLFRNKKRAVEDEEEDPSSEGAALPEAVTEDIEAEATTSPEDDAALPNFVNEALPSDVLPEGVATGKRTRPKFTVDHLMKADGMEWLREHMPKLAKFDHKDEAADAHRLVDLYRNWCRRLFPKLSFDEMLGRIDKFGSIARVRNVVESMRLDQHWGKKRAAAGDITLDDEDAKRLKTGVEETVETHDAGDQPANDQPNRDDHQPAADHQPTAPPTPAVDDDLKNKIEAKRQAALELRRQRQLQRAAAQPTPSPLATSVSAPYSAQ
ncbi:hypothetical protein CTAYLR_000457 [Chrysophaeum taylorii]|uniref:Chromosome segregation in meiosis protein 3 domain-containing protein n=1 Tax=Chrysophaeum taylorii TaxID=2483200 RepID=A0AAD7UFZ8_9STRA|nr:hypothetical protein CTAYLR_000457 [Chrysophaeum taylorii]